MPLGNPKGAKILSGQEVAKQIFVDLHMIPLLSGTRVDLIF
jgi:hypothetical protein